MHPQPPPRVRNKSNTSLILVIVLLGCALVCCCAPVVFFGGQHLLTEDGPYDNVPDICAAMTGDEIEALVGDADPIRGGATYVKVGDEADSCAWDQNETACRCKVSVSADLYKKAPIGRSGPERAEHLYEFTYDNDVENLDVAKSSFKPLLGAGDRAYILGEMTAQTDRYTLTAHALKGNVEIEVQLLIFDLTRKNGITIEVVREATEKFEKPGRNLLNDAWESF